MKNETGQISKVPIKKTFISHFRSWTIYYTEVTEKTIEGDMAAYNPDMVLEKLLSLQGKELTEVSKFTG